MEEWRRSISNNCKIRSTMIPDKQDMHCKIDELSGKLSSRFALFGEEKGTDSRRAQLYEGKNPVSVNEARSAEVIGAQSYRSQGDGWPIIKS